ncbi:MAG: ABC transporter permease [Saprospiraceae bacterium]|nr:ABC transporter permease [Saprospiraceae bacterium]
MINNYIKLAFRNLLRNRMQTLLNLGGLSIGLTCCLLIGLYIMGETRYDRHHSQADRIWRVTRSFLNNDGSVDLHLSAIAPPFGELLPQHFPEIENITRLLSTNTTVRTPDDRKFQENNVFFADEQFGRIFDLPMVSGSAATLAEPWQAILSETTAKRYFGDTDPIGQSLMFDNRQRVKVTGVYRDFPVASHLHPDLLLSFSILRDSTIYGETNLKTNFGNNAFYTYILTAPQFDPGKMAARFPAFLDQVFPPPPPNVQATRKPHEFTELHLQKLTDIHLKSHHDDEIEPGGDMARVRLFAAIAGIILLIAGINYVNLATAFSLRRAREVGVRKSAGAMPGQVRLQFLAESVLLTLFASAIAWGLTGLGVPLLEKTLGVELPEGDWLRWQTPAALFGAALFTGVLAGAYPALFMASFKPVAALKGAASVGGSQASMRKGLVVLQFTLATVLLVGTTVIYRQLNFLQNKSLGYNREQIINLPSNSDLTPRWESFRTELLSNPAVVGTTRSSRIPSGRLLDDLGNVSAQLGDTMSNPGITLKSIAVDIDFVPTYGIPLAAGRSFSREFLTDTTHAWLLNESAVRAIGWKTPDEAIGKRLNYGGRTDCFVVGVLKDFHFESLHQDILPMIFYIPRNTRNLGSITIKLGKNTPEGLAWAGKVWSQFNPDYPFQYTFLDENYGRLYQSEQQQGKLYLVFAGLAIFIACLGLFGLAMFAAHQRVKEIGVRKVLGASVAGITGLLARDFLKLVVLSVVLATPIAWYFMQRWLSDFAYRTEIQWWIFALAGAIAVLIAFLTVSFQSIKAALTDPVKSLRSE